MRVAGGGRRILAGWSAKESTEADGGGGNGGDVMGRGMLESETVSRAVAVISSESGVSVVGTTSGMVEGVRGVCNVWMEERERGRAGNYEGGVGIVEEINGGCAGVT